MNKKFLGTVPRFYIFYEFHIPNCEFLLLFELRSEVETTQNIVYKYIHYSGANKLVYHTITHQVNPDFIKLT